MKKTIGILGAGIAVLIAAGVMINSKSHTSLANMEKSAVVSDISGADESSTERNMRTYQSITMEEAEKRFSEEGDYIILDVRRADEFAEGHIPGAINVSNEEIGTVQPKELPEPDKTIYVYCRSGRRSKEAAKKLCEMGYTNIIECGGILDWIGECVTEGQPGK